MSNDITRPEADITSNTNTTALQCQYTGMQLAFHYGFISEDRYLHVKVKPVFTTQNGNAPVFIFFLVI